MAKKSLLDKFRTPEGKNRGRKRVGRGPSSGHGRTCGRGNKGENSRTGGPQPPWFEGGQMPLTRRLPKRGFSNIFRDEYIIVNLRDLNRFEDGETVNIKALYEKGLIGSLRKKIKILGQGSLERSLHVCAHRFSKSAALKIEEKGGKAEIL